MEKVDLFSERLRTLIGARNQKDFAEELGEVPQKITDYLTGRSRPGWGFMSKLAEKGVNVNWFLTGRGPVYVDSQQGGDLPENIQVLLREIEKIPGIVDDLTEVVRSKRQLEESLKVVKEALRKKKKTT